MRADPGLAFFLAIPTLRVILSPSAAFSMSSLILSVCIEYLSGVKCFIQRRT